MPIPILILIIPAILWTSDGFAAETCGTVLKLKGTVEIFSRQKKKDGGHGLDQRLAIVGREFGCDEIIVTRADSSVVIQMVTGKLSLGPKSRIEVAQFMPVSDNKGEVNGLNLIYGKIRLWMQKRADQRASFKVHTPIAVSGVRGTDFFVAHNGGGHLSHTATLEGQVEVARENSAASVLVNSGEQVSLGEGAPSLVPVPISEEIKTQVRTSSQLVQNDPQFTNPEAVQILGSPQTWRAPEPEETSSQPEPSESAKDKAAQEENPPEKQANLIPTEAAKPTLDRSRRWVLALGQGSGRIKHSSSDLDGDGKENGTLRLQLQARHKKKSWIGALALGNLGDQSFNSHGVKNSLSFLTAEGGVRFRHERWWSPYVRGGLAYAENAIEFQQYGTGNRSNENRRYILILATAGIDTFYLPWEKVGFYGAAEVTLYQSLFKGSQDTENQTGSKPPLANSSDDRLHSFGLNFNLGVVAYF